MIYDITKKTAPTMPWLGKGTECIKILLSQASKDVHPPLILMFSTLFGTHLSCAKIQYSEPIWQEWCGMVANLVADSSSNKGQLSHLVEAICRDFRVHDEGELKKLDGLATVPLRSAEELSLNAEQCPGKAEQPSMQLSKIAGNRPSVFLS